MTNLNNEEQKVWDNLEGYYRTRNDGTAMDYYTSVPVIKNLGIDLPARYHELCKPIPRILLEQVDGDIVNVYTESGDLIFAQEGFTDETAPELMEKLAQEFPDCMFDNINEIAGSGKSMIDGRFSSHHYRMDLSDRLGKVSDYLEFKRGIFDNIVEENAAAFDVVDRFFDYLYTSKRRIRNRRKNAVTDTQPEITYHYSTMKVRSGYDDMGRAFVAVPMVTESLPVYGQYESHRYEKVSRIYGVDTNEAYRNAAEFIIETYDMNGNLK